MAANFRVHSVLCSFESTDASLSARCSVHELTGPCSMICWASASTTPLAPQNSPQDGMGSDGFVGCPNCHQTYYYRCLWMCWSSLHPGCLEAESLSSKLQSGSIYIRKSQLQWSRLGYGTRPNTEGSDNEEDEEEQEERKKNIRLSPYNRERERERERERDKDNTHTHTHIETRTHTHTQNRPCNNDMNGEVMQQHSDAKGKSI